MDYRASNATAQLRSRIQDLVADSERLFLGFAETYPAFVREMQRSLEGSSRAVGTFSSDSNLEQMLQNLFASTRDVITASAGRFKEMHNRDDLLLSSLNRGIDTLSGLDAIIARIKEDSIEMELISLNAMTVALKSGSAGKAFSVITEELKRLSSRTISLTELLTEDGRDLLAQFRRYREQVEALEKAQRELFEGLDETIHAKFSALEISLREIANALVDLVGRSKQVEGPIRGIMETVQLQDLIRQSLDHVILALNELDAVSSEDPLDDLAFRVRLAELSESILSDVKIRLEGALSRLRIESSEVNRIVADGEKHRRRMIEDYFGRSNNGTATRSFDEASEIILNIERQVETYMRSKTAIIHNGAKLSASVEALEKQFRAFSKIIERFHTIDIASRIEVSKQTVLKTMDDTVTEMSALTTRIGTDVEEALQSTRGFIEDTKKSISAYADQCEAEDEKSAGGPSLMDAHHRLGDLKVSIQNGAQGFTLFTEEFLVLLRKSSTEVEGLTRLIQAIDDGSSELSQFRSDAASELKVEPGRQAYGSIHSEKLKQIIERFTIYAHKQAAGEIAGFAVEGGVQTGEVTLF